MAKGRAPLCARSQLREYFQRLLVLAGLEHLNFTLGSLRAGGATAAYNESRNIAALRFQGMWVGDASLEPYLQETTAQLVEADLGPAEELITCMLSFLPVFSEPPSLPWQHYFSRGRQISMLLRWRRQELAKASARLGRYGVARPSRRAGASALTATRALFASAALRASTAGTASSYARPELT